MPEVGDIMWLQNSTLERSWLHTGILVIDTAQSWTFPGLVHLQDGSYQRLQGRMYGMFLQQMPPLMTCPARFHSSSVKNMFQMVSFYSRCWTISYTGYSIKLPNRCE